LWQVLHFFTPTYVGSADAVPAAPVISPRPIAATIPINALRINLSISPSFLLHGLMD
jgi:hypothetical protein